MKCAFELETTVGSPLKSYEARARGVCVRVYAPVSVSVLCVRAMFTALYQFIRFLLVLFAVCRLTAIAIAARSLLLFFYAPALSISRVCS